MKYKILIFTTFFLLMLLSIISCDEVYDYEVNNTTWEIYVYWSDGFYQGEPTQITFFSDGTTSWGGTWKKTDELTFKWVIVYDGECTAIYYAQFKKDLTKLIGHCVNTLNYEGSFTANKISD